MERDLAAVTVFIGAEGHVCMKTPNYGDGEHVIALHPEQVDLVCKWLQEAKAEALDPRRMPTE